MIDHLAEPANGFVEVAFDRIRQAKIVERDSGEPVVARLSRFLERGLPVFNRSLGLARSEATQPDGVVAPRAKRVQVARRDFNRRSSEPGRQLAVAAVARYVSLATKGFRFDDFDTLFLTMVLAIAGHARGSRIQSQRAAVIAFNQRDVGPGDQSSRPPVE